MIGVQFRPHRLSFLIVTDGEYDEKGDFVKGQSVWSEQIPCRYEPNGKALTVPFGEGKEFVYSYTVYLNQNCPEIKYGQKVILYDKEGNSMGEFQCQGFHRGQLNAKIWL